jgi:hypothetical protein
MVSHNRECILICFGVYFDALPTSFRQSESPASFYKNQTTEIDLDFMIPNGARYAQFSKKDL